MLQAKRPCCSGEAQQPAAAGAPECSTGDDAVSDSRVKD